MRINRFNRFIAAPLLLLLSNIAVGHGALSGDEDTCVLSVGPYRMHFSGYQPSGSGSDEFCEDIPATGQAGAGVVLVCSMCICSCRYR